MRFSSFAGVLVAAAVVASCGSSAPNLRAEEYFDEATGATITRAEKPIVFYSDDPARAANARDYIYLAPLVVNQSGKRSGWLWLGLWSTIDRNVTGGAKDRLADLSGVVLIVDGEPMELDMGARADRIPGVGHLPYEAPVATARSVFVPVTASQLARLGGAGHILARTEMANGDVLFWQPWTGDGSQAGFAQVAAAPPGSTR